jgi:single-stranded-DNA-specific exonuclease
MSVVKQYWELLEAKRPDSVQEVLETLLINRGVGPSFLNTSLRDLEPYLKIRGMDEGATLTARHLSEGHKIVLVGDYDCDGITSAAQFSLFLKDIGYRFYDVVIPNRAEGYGIPERAVLKHSDAKLFVALDCGTLDVKAVSKARSQGADCIVIDHHEVPEDGVAPASLLINPKQPDCSSVFKEFSTSGLTLLFLARLRKAIGKNFSRPILGEKYLSLAALGTVADMVPLIEGNRIIAKTGLNHLNQVTYAPIREIIDVAGLTGKSLTAGHIGYYLAPRINAAGRISDAHVAYDLLVSDNTKEIKELTQKLNRLNSQRQHQEDTILRTVRERFNKEAFKRRTLVMGDSQWPHGLVGIVASRVQREIHYGPAVIFSVDEKEGIARGSARSISGFDIYSALKQCDDLLIRWGGHRMAAGMTVALDQIDVFRDRFEEIALQYDAEVFTPKGKMDLELDLTLIKPELLDALRQFEPHGLGNPAPVFVSRHKKVSIQKVFGRNNDHLRVLIGNSVKGVFWRGNHHQQMRHLQEGDMLDVIFQLEWDNFDRGPVLNIKDTGHFFSH